MHILQNVDDRVMKLMLGLSFVLAGLKQPAQRRHFFQFNAAIKQCIPSPLAGVHCALLFYYMFLIYARGTSLFARLLKYLVSCSSCDIIISHSSLNLASWLAQIKGMLKRNADPEHWRDMAKDLFKAELFTEAMQCYSLAGDHKGTQRCKVSVRATSSLSARSCSDSCLDAQVYAWRTHGAIVCMGSNDGV